ncbi:hypothetical protein VLK31_15395 [Variovorax sp. H27-G14]|uniref:hypothetical protein n=1 Tax=Variovorax sp. H27-G14 TaxID=3111914 RepID=UPI0038FC3724
MDTLVVIARSTTALKTLTPMVGFFSRNKGGGRRPGDIREKKHAVGVSVALKVGARTALKLGAPNNNP